MLCCLLCLTVCAAPALAANDEHTSGFIVWSDNTSLLFSGPEVINVVNGYFPASFSAENGMGINNTNRQFQLIGSPIPHTDANVSLYSDVNFYVEVLFSTSDPLSVTISSPDVQPRVSCLLALDTLPLANFPEWAVRTNGVSLVLDDSLTDLQGMPGEDSLFLVPTGTYEVSRYWGYRFNFPTFSLSREINGDALLRMLWAELAVNYEFSQGSSEVPADSIYDQIIINTGVLREINGTLTDIKTTTVQIQSDVSEIKDGLQDSNSSIWGAFKDSVSGLFVPSSADLEGVKNGFDQLAQDKLGGAYQTVEWVDIGVQSVVDKFKNPGSSPGVEFPGISVPLGGDVGTVTLAASQTVTIPEEITSVLYPVAGFIIPIVCVIWTIRQCTDMVECFMSGMSYAEFLHRSSDEEDEEV